MWGSGGTESAGTESWACTGRDSRSGDTYPRCRAAIGETTNLPRVVSHPRGHEPLLHHPRGREPCISDRKSTVRAPTEIQGARTVQLNPENRQFAPPRPHRAPRIRPRVSGLAYPASRIRPRVSGLAYPASRIRPRVPGLAYPAPRTRPQPRTASCSQNDGVVRRPLRPAAPSHASPPFINRYVWPAGRSARGPRWGCGRRRGGTRPPRVARSTRGRLGRPRTCCDTRTARSSAGRTPPALD